MLLILGAILAGILIGLILGGSLRQLAEIHLRWWPLAIIGLALQLAPVPSLEGRLDHWLAVGLLIASYVALLAFVLGNIRLPGFWLVATGFALNFLVISINGGMPVTREALAKTYGSDYPNIVAQLQQSGGAKHHLARPDDDLILLTDVIPVGAPMQMVLSVGDVMFFLGVTWVIAAATKGPPGRHRAGRKSRRSSGEGAGTSVSEIRPGPEDYPEAPRVPAPAPRPP